MGKIYLSKSDCETTDFKTKLLYFTTKLATYASKKKHGNARTIINNI